ncbi:MAG TPA: hypothetical protein PK228_09725 [Saprospiraceae bacterium]|nr:hypothetical protein [Saprospiraceae bacterium]
MKKLIHITGLLILVAMIACENKSSSMYENCCGTAPVADSVDLNAPWDTTFDNKGRVYIPNLFTPNTLTGVDEFFIIFGGNGVKAIESAKYTDESGEVLFEHTLLQANDVGASWNGMRNGDSTFYYGSFNYEVKVEFVDGQKKTYTGKACSFKCGDAGFPNEKLPDCFFPDQNNGNGAPDPSLPQPIGCF